MKKGFTLIEILAIIAVISIIAVIIIPKYQEQNKIEKERELSKNIEMILSSSKVYLSNKQIDNGTIIPLSNLCEEKYLECPFINPVNDQKMNGYVCGYIDSDGVYGYDYGEGIPKKCAGYPEVNSTEIFSNNSSDKLAKNGDTITLKVKFSVPLINTPTITINGRSTTVTKVGEEYIATYLIPVLESTMTEGYLDILIKDFMDENENSGMNFTQITTGNNVVYDRTNPVCTNSGGSASWRNTNVTLTGSCNDTLSGCLGGVTRIISNEINSSTESPGTVYDKAGNSTTCTANQIVKIDKTNPTCSSSGGSTTWRNTNLTLTGTCSDSLSGCAGNVTRTLSSDINSTTETPGNVSDNAGNSVTCPANQTVRIDKTSPTCSIAKSNTGTTAGVTATVTGSDGGSGIASGNGTFTGLTSNKTYTVTDNVGNTGSCTITVTAQTQYRSATCSAHTACSSCPCSSYGNYTSSTNSNGTCTQSGNPGTHQVYIRCGQVREWTCNCRGNPQPNCTWTAVARYGIENSCPTACVHKGVPPGYNGCSSASNDEWASVTKQDKTTYTGSCTAYQACSSCPCSSWGGFGSWSTTVCTPTGYTKKCETRTVYN